MRSRFRHLVVILFALTLTAGTCDDGGGSAGPTTTTSPGSQGSGPSTTEDPEDTTTTSADGGSGASTTSSSTPCPANTNPQAADTVTPRAELTAVRAAHQPGFDRIVFEFRGTAPGFRVEYGSKPVTEDGSGDEVELRGRYVLYVRMDNATGWDFEASRPTYTGPKRIRPGDTRVVRELVQSGDFEGVLNWAIGLDAKNGFRVRKLAGPPRLMIEVCA